MVQLFPYQVGWKGCERCYICDMNTQGSLRLKEQLAEEDDSELLEVECMHCGVTVHHGCVEAGWELFCSCETHVREREKEEENDAEKMTRYFPRCLSCTLPPRRSDDVDILFNTSPTPAAEDCCVFCLQCVTKPEATPGPVDPLANRKRNILVTTKGGTRYEHAACRDVDLYAYSSHCFVVPNKSAWDRHRKHLGLSGPDWLSCQADTSATTNSRAVELICAEPDKEGSKVVKCVNQGCLYVIHPGCIGATDKVNVTTMFVGDADKRPTVPALLLPRDRLDVENVSVEFFCPQHLPFKQFDGDDVMNMMAAQRPVCIDNRFHKEDEEGEGEEEEEGDGEAGGGKKKATKKRKASSLIDEQAEEDGKDEGAEKDDEDDGVTDYNHAVLVPEGPVEPFREPRLL